MTVALLAHDAVDRWPAGRALPRARGRTPQSCDVPAYLLSSESALPKVEAAREPPASSTSW